MNEPANWPVTCLQELQWQIAAPRGSAEEAMESVYEARVQWQWRRGVIWSGGLVSGILVWFGIGVWSLLNDDWVIQAS
jgi:hypothetical protein